jgi:tetratricopeptide (TPR) repeat protein
MLEAWVEAERGSFVEAEEMAVLLGDPSLASAFAVLEGRPGSPGAESPPPWIGSDIWRDYRNGSVPRGDSAAVLAVSSFAAGDMETAVETALQIRRDRIPCRPWALAAASVVLASAGQADAVLLADSALSLARNPGNLMYAARVEAILGNHAEAADLLGEASAIARLSPATAIEHASSLWESGDLAAAASEYSRALELGAALPPAGKVRMGWAEALLLHGGS